MGMQHQDESQGTAPKGAATERNAQEVDVLRNAIDSLESFEPCYPTLDDARKAVAAVAELVEAGKRVTDAFRALGKAGGMAEVAKRHQECEAAMLALDAAVSRAQGGAA